MSVTALESQCREPVLDGRAFGAAGAYEKIVGTLRFAVDPALPIHADITDLDRAPRNSSGLVEGAADFYMLRPVGGGNRTLLLDVANRGRKVALGMFNSAVRVPDPTTADDFGNGFLLRHGYTLAWVGWQHEVPRVDGMMAMDAPDRHRRHGRVRAEWCPNTRVDRLPLADRYHVPQPTLDVNDPGARLLACAHTGAPSTEVPRDRWRFADPTHIDLDGGFTPGAIYDLIYRAQDPVVTGFGFITVRDTAAWLRHATDGNPCAGVARSRLRVRRLAVRPLPASLPLPRAERGRAADGASFDAVWPHVAGARRGEFNLRFGQPSLNAKEAVGSLFPFTDVEQGDRLTGQRGSLLGRQASRSGLPKIFTTNTSAEYWRGDGSLVHTDVDARVRRRRAAGRAYVPVRRHAAHARRASAAVGRSRTPADAACSTFNLVDYAPLLRAALVNLDRVGDGRHGAAASAVPRVGDHPPCRTNRSRRSSPRCPACASPTRSNGRCVSTSAPTGRTPLAAAENRRTFATLVSAVDADGNEIAGIRPVELAVPLGDLHRLESTPSGAGRAGRHHVDDGLDAAVRAHRRGAGAAGRSTRLSIAERYASRDDYLARVRAAAETLVSTRHMLAEDVEPVLARAATQWDLFREGL